MDGGKGPRIRDFLSGSLATWVRVQWEGGLGGGNEQQGGVGVGVRGEGAEWGVVGGKELRGGVGSSGDGEVQAAVGRKRCLDPGPLAFREPVRRGLCGCRAAGQRGSGFTL